MKRFRLSQTRLWMGAWLFASASSLFASTTVTKVVKLDSEGTNYDIDSAQNGDLHMACRVGTGAQSNYKKIVYYKYTKGSDSWGASKLVYQPSGSSDLNVSIDIDTNQPACAWDEHNQGAWITFSGDVRRANQVNGYFVRPSEAVQVFDLLGGIGPLQEIRAVDIAVAPDGHVWSCWTYINSNNTINGIYCNNDVDVAIERATGKDGAGEGLTLQLGPTGKPSVATTFNKGGTNAAWSPRDSVNGQGQWQPYGLYFGGIPFSAGKINCSDTANDNLLNCAAITAKTTAERITFAFSLDRSSGNAIVSKGSAVSDWGVSVDGGRANFNSESIKFARSAQGKEALAYAMDFDAAGGLDLGIIMVKPAGVDWPQNAFVDANGDGIHDDMGGKGQTPRQYFSQSGADLYHVFEGTQGRAVVAFIFAETPSVAFSGEDLWVVYHDDNFEKATKAAKISVGAAVPEMPWAAGLLLLALFSLALLRAEAARRAKQTVNF